MLSNVSGTHLPDHVGADAPIRQARYTEARDHLERAGCSAREHKETRVDYAIALAGVGDLVSAQAMLDALLDEPDLPPRLRQKACRTSATHWQAWMMPSGRPGSQPPRGWGTTATSVGRQPGLTDPDSGRPARAAAA